MTFRTTRNELYKKVWREPVVHFAGDLGVVGTTLKKACGKHDIPRSWRGRVVLRNKVGLEVTLPLGQAAARCSNTPQAEFRWCVQPSDRAIEQGSKVG